MDRAKYHPGNYLVYLFNSVGTKVATESGFTSLTEADDWRQAQMPKGGSGAVLRVIRNTLINPAKDSWAGELPEEQ